MAEQRPIDSASEQGFTYIRNRAMLSSLQAMDPEALSEFLHERVKANNEMLLSGADKRARKMASKELEFIRNAIHKNTVDAGKHRNELIHLYDRAIGNTMETTASMVGTVKRVQESLMRNLPSVDTFMSAITVSNPVVGFGLRFGKTLASSAKEMMAKGKKNIDDERLKLKQELENVKEDAEEDGELIQVSIEDYVHEDQFLKRLDSIDDALYELIQVTRSVWNEEKEFNRDRALQEDIENLNRLEDSSEFIGPMMPEVNIGQPDNTNTLLERMGLLAILKDSMKGMFGGIGGVFRSLGGFLLGPAGMLLMGLGGAAVMFKKGFDNASEILGKAEEDLTELDKISAGMGSIVGTLGHALDGVLGVFGIKTDFGDKLTKFAAEMFLTYYTGAIDMFKSIFDFITVTIPEWVNGIIDDAVLKFNEGIDFITNIRDKISMFIGDFIDSIVDTVKGIIEKVKNFLPNMIMGFLKKTPVGIALTVGSEAKEAVGGLVNRWFGKDESHYSDSDIPGIDSIPTGIIDNPNAITTTLRQTSERARELERITQTVGNAVNIVQDNSQTVVGGFSDGLVTPMSTHNNDSLFDRMNYNNMQGAW